MDSKYNSRPNKPIVLLTIRCVELARTNKAILVAYNNRELWFTKQFIKELTTTDDGYTHMKVPAWMFKERVERDIAARKKMSEKEELLREYKINKRKKAVLAGNTKYGYYDAGVSH